MSNQKSLFNTSTDVLHFVAGFHLTYLSPSDTEFSLCGGSFLRSDADHHERHSIFPSSPLSVSSAIVSPRQSVSDAAVTRGLARRARASSG